MSHAHRRPRALVTAVVGTLLVATACGDDGRARMADTGVPPTDTGVAPTDTGVAPTDTGVALTDTGVAPTDTGVVPTDTGVAPTDTGVVPTDTGVAPTDTGVADAGVDAGMPTCPAAPAGADAEQMAALARTNEVRLAAGIPCASMATTINQAATAHCAYYAQHRTTSSCFVMGNSHTEVASCSGFTGAQFWNRMTAAGYTGQARFEDMAFANDGRAAVQQWIDSVWHRTPVLSPWTRELGYGHTTGCDTMDFAVGAATSATFVATYPFAAQSGVPRSFDGRNEGPEPPRPPSGWPSGYPVTVYAKGIPMANHGAMVHTIRVDGTAVDLPHQWITPSTNGLLSDEYVLYTNAPLAAQTTYRVHVEGMRTSGLVTFDFTFTTGN